jgi:hypothetical protein
MSTVKKIPTPSQLVYAKVIIGGSSGQITVQFEDPTGGQAITVPVDALATSAHATTVSPGFYQAGDEVVVGCRTQGGSSGVGLVALGVIQ